jgi:hypothetical protein
MLDGRKQGLSSLQQINMSLQNGNVAKALAALHDYFYEHFPCEAHACLRIIHAPSQPICSKKRIC